MPRRNRECNGAMMALEPMMPVNHRLFTAPGSACSILVREPSRSHTMIAFVTGATAGFGLEITRRLVAAGHAVVAVGRRRDRLDALRAELATDRLYVDTLDVRDNEAVVRLVEALPHAFAAIDLLVNNAGAALGLEPAHR